MEDTELLKKFKTETDAAFQSAYHSEKGGDAKWQAVLERYSAQPLSPEEKDALAKSTMKITRGCWPIELRRVYEKIISAYSMQAGESANLRAALTAFDMDSKVLEYYQKVKAFGGLGDIFKNASTGTAKYSQGLQKEKQLTIKCKNCGAPRLEEMQYDNCLFCGSKLFETGN